MFETHGCTHPHARSSGRLQEEREITKIVSDEIKLHLLGKGKKYPGQLSELPQLFPVFIVPVSPAMLYSQGHEFCR